MKHLEHAFRQLSHLISGSERILIVSHKGPDGDTIGASTALSRWCRLQKKDVVLFCIDAPASVFRYLDEVRRYQTDPSVFFNAYDLVIVVDAGDLDRAGVSAFMSNLPSGYVLVNIDHHASAGCGNLNIVVQGASSTCEIVYRFFETNGIAIDSEMATSLLTGLSTDTSNFSNGITSASSIEVSSALIGFGARFSDILRYIWRNKTVETLKLWGTVLSRIRYHRTYDLAVTWMTEEESRGVESRTIEEMKNFLIGVIKDADTLFFLREGPEGRIHGTFRSQKRSILKLAQFFGGGGHHGSAGFSIEGKLVVGDDGIPRIG